MATMRYLCVIALAFWWVVNLADGEDRPVPFHVRSKQFKGGDEVAIQSLVKLEATPEGRPRYEIKGRYRLESADGAELCQWCSNGKLAGNKGIEIKRGEGEFRLTFTLIESGNLHLSLYPLVDGNRSSFGSLYYDLASPSESVWQTEKSEFFNLHFTPESGRDARHVKSCLEMTVERLGAEFGKEPARSLLGAATIDVYVHPKATEKAQEGLLTLNTNQGAGRLVAEIHLLALSAHRPSSTAVGEPMDENYMFKTLVHEYSTILLEQMTRSKPKGWIIYSGPAWFVQGYQEYLGLTLSSEHSRTVTFQKYRDLLRQDASRVTPQFDTKNPYTDGPVIVEFLHQTYGKEKVQGMLLSEQADFWSAVEATLGVNREQLYEAWAKWVRRL